MPERKKRMQIESGTGGIHSRATTVHRRPSSGGWMWLLRPPSHAGDSGSARAHTGANVVVYAVGSFNQ